MTGGRSAGRPARLSGDELAAALGRHLGGTVTGLRRLSGGASRVTSAFELEPAAKSNLNNRHTGNRNTSNRHARKLILQMERAGASQGSKIAMEAALLRAARAAGVPVPAVVALGNPAQPNDPSHSNDPSHPGDPGDTGDPDQPDQPDPDQPDLGAGWIVLERLEGETIPRKVLRDPEWAEARRALTAQCASALVAIHSVDPETIEGLGPRDQLHDPRPFLDALGEVRPALELGVRWLEEHRPPAGARVTVHGDFRLGNLLVGPHGLVGVLDWELAHAGDPAEDLGWLAAPAWRFGGSGEVGGFGDLDDLLTAYTASGGEPVHADRIHWWQVYATVKWATMCALQASAHLSGLTRSVELAAIGRRVCESEWDLFVLLGQPPGQPPPVSTADPVKAVSPVSPFGRPTAAELVEAVREYVEGLMERQDGGAAFEARVARNALAIVEREQRLGPAVAAAHADRIRALGFGDDAGLAAAIRSGHLDADWQTVAGALAASARDQLLVANPTYLPPGNA